VKILSPTRFKNTVSIRERCDLLIKLGEARSRKGEHDAAEDCLLEAGAFAERLKDPERLTRIVLAIPAMHWPGPGEANPLAELLARRGLVIEREDRSRRAILMARLAAELSYTPGKQSCSADLAMKAMEQALDARDSQSELYVRLYRDVVLRKPEQLSEHVANAEEILRLAIEAGDYSACCIAALEKASSLTTLGDTTAAEHAAELAMSILPSSQVRSHQGLPVVYCAYRAVMDGRFTDASHDFDRCRALANAEKFPCLLDVCWPTMLAPYMEQGRLPELVAMAEQTVHRRRSVSVYSALLSWLKMELGCFADAIYILERLAADNFANLSGAEGLVGVAALANVCAALNRSDYAAILYDRLLPYAGLNVTLNALAAFGSVERYLGILALILDRLDEAIWRFERAFRFDRRTGARPWAIYSGLELVSSWGRRARADDRAMAHDLLACLEAEATGLQMRVVLSKLSVARESLCAGKAGDLKTRDISSTPIAVIAGPNPEYGLMRMVNSSTPQDTALLSSIPPYSDKPTPLSNDRVAIFCRNGEYWQVGYQKNSFSIRHRGGLELISLLVRYEGRGFFALELIEHIEAQPRNGLQGGPIADYEDAPVLDAEAKRSYRERLMEIREELERLREANDIERATKLETEQDFLTRELARALGLFGRDRKLGSESERARKRVSVAIARVIRLISLHDQHFGRYLKRSIKTGNVCSYNSDPENPVTWIL